MTLNLLLKLLLSGFGVSLLAYFIVCLALLIGQNRLLFLPVAKVERTPRDIGLEYEEVWIGVRTWGGKIERVHGWWIPGAKGNRQVLLYFHGNGGNISYNLGAIQAFHRLGFSTLLFDYRGYGKSEGAFPTEAEVYRDAGAAWDYLVKTRGIEPENIFLYGHSLGGAIAIDLAVRQPKAAGVIADATFTSLRAVIDRIPLYRFFPADLLLTQHFDSLSKLRLLRAPLLLIHGAEDRTVPATMSQVLYDKATVPKQLLIVQGAGHNDLISIAGESYLNALENFTRVARSTPRSFVNP
jgi:pimeloyl-ACP methyl ester carboxylesterase